jgi:ParB/RepB/Spo0J family partition protein
MKPGNIKTISVGRKDLYSLSPDDIREENGWNVRVEGDDLDSHIRLLADSIKEIGVLQPITVYMQGGFAFITDGHCRFQAVKLAISEGAEIKSIPVRTEEKTANDADRVLSMLTRNSGRSLSMPEQAEVVRRLLAFGWSSADISKRTGQSRQHLGNLETFLSAPEEVKNLVNAGKVSPTMAITQVRKEGGAAALQTINAAVVTAKTQGKKKATKKHLAKNTINLAVNVIDLAFKQIEEFANSLPEEDCMRAGEIYEACSDLKALCQDGN